jgi:hypothetical protein
MRRRPGVMFAAFVALLCGLAAVLYLIDHIGGR